MEYTSLDRIFNRLYRDLRDTTLNESDVIEWIGEAMDFLKVAENQEQALAFIEVKDYQAAVPYGMQTVLQIAKNNNFSKEDFDLCPASVVEETEEEEGSPYPVILDCNGTPVTDVEVAYYRPFFDLQYEYDPWNRSNLYSAQYTPVRLANHSLFGVQVCKEKGFEDLYQNSEDEYNIVGTQEKRFQFSFETGSVAVSYLRNAVDARTGYPLVPDQISFISAITYYVKWKVAEWYAWNGRRGADSQVAYNRGEWLRYARQAKNWAKMPKSIDTYQNMLEQTHYLIPRLKRYYGFFGNLGRSEQRQFNDPDYRRKLEFYSDI